MAISQADRLEMFEGFKKTFGVKVAETLIEELGSHNWDDVARRADTQALATDVRALKSDVQTVQADIHNLKSDVLSVRSDLQNLDTKIDSVEERLRIKIDGLDEKMGFRLSSLEREVSSNSNWLRVLFATFIGFTGTVIVMIAQLK